MSSHETSPHYRPSLNTLLGITKAKKRVKKEWASPTP